MTWKNAHGVSIKVIIKSMWDVRWYILWKKCILFLFFAWKYTASGDNYTESIWSSSRRNVHRKPYGAYFLIRRITQAFFFHLVCFADSMQCNIIVLRSYVTLKIYTLPFISENYKSQSSSARASHARWLIRTLIQCFSMYKTSVRPRMNIYILKRKKFQFHFAIKTLDLNFWIANEDKNSKHS